MINHFKKLISHPLFSGSAVMVIGTNFSNIINYIYHLVMGRSLGPNDYGELASLISLIGLVGVIALALHLVVVKYISSIKDEDEIASVNSWFENKVLIISVGIFLIISLISPFIASFLRIDNLLLVILTAVYSAFSLLATKNKAVLQGILKFKEMVMVLTAENSIKLILGVVFIYLGFKVGGVMVALVLAPLLGWVVSRTFLTAYSKSQQKYTPHINSMVLYTLPVFLQSIATTSLYSIDLVLVKHFFSSTDAGIYAAVSTLGKIIYFGAGPIGLVMFPLVARKQAKGENYQRIFIYSLIATGVLSISVLGLFRFFPEMAVVTLYGLSYLPATNLLVLFGVFMTFFTLSVLLINFHLSLRQTKIVALPILAALAQIGGILVFHQSLYVVVIVSVVVSFFLLASLLLYTFVKSRK